LSSFLADAEFNDRATAANFPGFYNVLREIDQLFRAVEEATENDNREQLLVSRFLIGRTHSALLAAIRLAMSGQIFECCPVLRAAVELAWYSLDVAKDPKPPSRSEILAES